MNIRLKKEIKDFIKYLRFHATIVFKIYYRSRISLNALADIILLNDKDINKNNNDERNEKKKQNRIIKYRNLRVKIR